MKTKTWMIDCPRCGAPTTVYSTPDEDASGNFQNDLRAECPNGHDLTFDEITNTDRRPGPDVLTSL